jgi:hypothetical protein
MFISTLSFNIFPLNQSQKEEAAYKRLFESDENAIAYTKIPHCVSLALNVELYLELSSSVALLLIVFHRDYKVVHYFFLQQGKQRIGVLTIVVCSLSWSVELTF